MHDRIRDSARHVGATGPQGAQGPAGNVGAQGPAGATGAQGSVGATGTNGTNGAPGTDCAGATPIIPARTCPGATGASGPQGSVGATGAPGPTGTSGTNGVSGYEHFTNTCTSSTSCQTEAGCNFGHVVTGGGAAITGTNTAYIEKSQPDFGNPNGWIGSANFSGNTATLTVWVLCAVVGP